MSKKISPHCRNKCCSASAFSPSVTIPAICIPLGGDRYEIRPGKPVIDQELITTRRASAMLCLSMDRICEMCEQGLLEAIKPGGRPTAQWRISMESVLRRTTPCA